MSLTLEEALGLEQNIATILEHDPSLYSPLSISGLQVELSSLQLEQGWTKHSAAVKFFLGLGLAFNHLYKKRIGNMRPMCDRWLGKVKGIPAEELSYPLNKDTLYDLRDYGRFVPSFDDPNTPDLGELAEVVFRLVETRGLPIIPGYDPEQIALQLVKLSYRFDEFAITEQFSHRGIKRGERFKQLNCYNVYNVLIDEFNTLTTSNPPSSQYLRYMAEKVAVASQILIEVASDYETPSPLTARIEQEITLKEQHLYNRGLTIGFNSNWKDNSVNQITPCCIYNFKNKDGTEFKKGKHACYSLLYSLDPTTHQLFLTSNASEAQAAVILFEAEDSAHNPYLVLEGVVGNQDFFDLDFLGDPKFRIFNPTELYQRSPPLDLILYYSAQCAYQMNRSLFINMTEITGMEEYGPHDFLYYLPRVFSGLSDRHEMIEDPRGGDKKLAISVFEGAETVYLRKDNSLLLGKLKELGVDLPSNLFDSAGRLELMAHTWADPRNPNTWVNGCEGLAHGKIVPYEQLREIFQ